MSVVEYDHRIVPLTLRIYLHLALVREMHCIVHSELLPFFKLCRSIGLLPSFYVDELIFRTSHIRDRESWALYNMVDHSAVSSFGQLPVP